VNAPVNVTRSQQTNPSLTPPPSRNGFKTIPATVLRSGVGVDDGKKRICLNDVSGDEQNRGNESQLDGVKCAAIVLDKAKSCFGFGADSFCKTLDNDLRVHGVILRD